MKNPSRSFFKLLFLFILSLLIGCGGGGGGDGGGGDVAVDTTPPAVPTDLAATAVSASRIDVSWSTSDEAVGYKVYRGGTFLQYVYNSTTFSDLNLTANTTYTYRVAAFDSAGNESVQSASASATTYGTATRLAGTGSNDYGRGVAIDGNGNVSITGWTAGNLDGFANPGGADVFLAKFNSSGIKQWTRLLGTTGVVDPTAGIDMGNYGLNVAVDSTRGYVYATGYTTAAMDGQPFVGGRDAFLVRYDLNGDNKQTRLFAMGAGDDVGNAVAVDVNGNVYVAGYTGPAGGTTDILLLKYNVALGNPIYRTVASEGDDVATGVAISEDGYAMYLTGLAGGVLPLNLLTAGYSGGGDLFVAKFDSVPNLQWTTYLGSSEMDAGLSITVHKNNTIFVAGMTNGALPGKTNAGGSDIIAASYTPAGAVNWTAQLGTAADESANGIVVDSIGNSYLTGFTSGNLSPFKPNEGLEDIFMARLSIGGTIFSYSIAGTTGGDEGRGIAIRESDRLLYVVGFTQGNLDGEANAGGYDAALLKFNLEGEQQ